MHRGCTLGCLLAGLLSPAVAPAAEPDPDLARVEKLIEESRKQWDVPGMAVVIVRGNETLLAKGFGRRSASKPEPVTPDTLFPLASCSKAFTTTLFAMLVDEGVMGWDDPLRKHFSGFTLSDPNANALLSMRDLLCHRTGLDGHDLLWFRAPWSIDEVLKRASLLPLDYPFRGGYRYSSIPFLAAGRAMEQRTGEKWEKLVRSRICEPLSMSGVRFTTIDLPDDLDRAVGHRTGKRKVEGTPAYEMKEPNPAGSVHATARDVAAWLKFHLSEGRDAEGTRLMSAKSLRETHTPQNIIRLEGLARSINPDTVQLSYGMGWLIYDHRGKKVISHGGMIDGFRVQITFLPEENLGFAVLANLHETRANAAIINDLIDLYCGLPARDWNEYFRVLSRREADQKQASIVQRNKGRDPASKPSLPLMAYAGEYRHPAYGTARVTLEDGRLVLAWSSFVCPLEHFDGDRFRVTEGMFEDQLVPFQVGEGRVKTLRFADQEFSKR
jgi:CubicO group peptidase (beta-lactamase class C family)